MCGYFACVYVCVPCARLVLTEAKMVSEPLELELQAVLATMCCWGLNLRPLEEQSICLTTEPYLLSHPQIS